MADTVSKEVRSRNMSAIRSKDTKPEVFIRSLLFNHGFRFRKNVSKLPGHPDIWLKKYNTVIFVHGCFWHRHQGCKYAYIPKSRMEYWNNKFQYNVTRDKNIILKFHEMNIKVLIIWECSITKKTIDSNKLLEIIKLFLLSNSLYEEI